MRTDITESHFDTFLAEHATVAVMIHAPGEFSGPELDALAGVCESRDLPSALAVIDSSVAPGVAAMFGVLHTPYLLIFRDRIALFAEAVRPTPAGLEALLAQIQQLDLEKVRADIEAERQAQESLLLRRACPTRYSGPARSG